MMAVPDLRTPSDGASRLASIAPWSTGACSHLASLVEMVPEVPWRPVGFSRVRPCWMPRATSSAFCGRTP